ncbi:MAG: DeoR/GlpR transcriptional regulator [Spirochaetales bacterium]|nr:DeoR/GlpR transcriptional regulator [Spirochaetales bacterium]
MLAEPRRIQILELLREEGSATVKRLSELFGVTAQTIRQDLDRLTQEGFILRDHGGAFLKTIPEQVRSLTLQHSEHMDKKRAIGREAARYVHDTDSLILDCGSTVTELAKNLTDKKGLRIVTNALNIALLLGSVPGCELMMSGGVFKPPTLSLTGEKAEEFFTQLHVDALFLATGGISEDFSLTYPGLNDIPIKRAMIAAASSVYLLADSTKIGKPEFASLGSISMVDYLVTDAEIRRQDILSIEKLGVKVLIAR